METKIAKNITQYIELVYSEKSELKSTIDLQEKKKAACLKAKLDYDNKDVQDIVNMRNTDINERIFQFLVTQNSNEYMLLVSDQHLFMQMQRKQMEPLKDGVDDTLKDLELKTRLSEKSDELLKRIKLRHKAIFGEGEEGEQASDKIRTLTPEQRLKQKSA